MLVSLGGMYEQVHKEELYKLQNARGWSGHGHSSTWPQPIKVPATLRHGVQFVWCIVCGSNSMIPMERTGKFCAHER